MRHLSLLLIILLVCLSPISAQSPELLLEWDPAYGTVRGSVDLQGSANIEDQLWFYVEAAPYDSEAWTPVSSPQMAPVIDGGLGSWNTAVFTDGFYKLRLHAVNGAGESLLYVLGPILVNNDGGLVSGQLVEVMAMPGDAGMQSAPVLENRLPLPVGGHIQSFGETTQAALSAAGMTWVKKQVAFGISDGKDLIDAAHAQGYKVMLGALGDKNQLAADFDGYVEKFAEYVGYLAGLGADAIEVWNEPNIEREWPNGSISGASYARMLKPAYAAIKAANPDTMVISAAPAPTGFFGGGCGWSGCDDHVYMAQMANAGVANHADCIGVHYNEGILPPTSQGGDPRGEYPTRYLPLMLQRVAWAFRHADIPMCLTEIGYLSPEGYGPLPRGFTWASTTSVSEQAAWLAKAMQIAADYRDMPVEVAVIWNIDFDVYDADPQAGYAIIRRDGSCPACQSIAALQS